LLTLLLHSQVLLTALGIVVALLELLRQLGFAAPHWQQLLYLLAALLSLATLAAVAWLLRLEAQRYDPTQRLDLATLRRQWRSLPPLPATASPVTPLDSPLTNPTYLIQRHRCRPHAAA